MKLVQFDCKWNSQTNLSGRKRTLKNKKHLNKKKKVWLNKIITLWIQFDVILLLRVREFVSGCFDLFRTWEEIKKRFLIWVSEVKRLVSLVSVKNKKKNMEDGDDTIKSVCIRIRILLLYLTFQRGKHSVILNQKTLLENP